MFHKWSKPNAAAIVSLALLLIAGALLLYISRYLLFAAVLGAVLANAIYRISAAFEPKLKIPALWLSIAQLLLFAGLILGIVYLGYDAAAAQIDELIASFKQAYQNLKATLQQTEWGSSLVGDDQQSNGVARHALEWSAGLASRFFSSLGPIAIMLIVLVYGSLEPQPYRRGLLWLLPKTDTQKRAIDTLNKVSDALLWWLAGRVASMLVVGIMSGLGLWILGVPGPLALGLIAGLFSFVPNLGPILALIPACLVAFSVSPNLALYVLVLYVAVQAVESNLITPMIQRGAVTVPPILLIIFQLALGLIAGVWGMIVATPLLVVILVLTQKLYLRDHLNRDGPMLTED